MGFIELSQSATSTYRCGALFCAHDILATRLTEAKGVTIMDMQTIATLVQIKSAIGDALSKEQQLFVSEKYGEFVAFLHSDTGKNALRNLVEEWQTMPE